MRGVFRRGGRVGVHPVADGHLTLISAEHHVGRGQAAETDGKCLAATLRARCAASLDLSSHVEESPDRGKMPWVRHASAQPRHRGSHTLLDSQVFLCRRRHSFLHWGRRLGPRALGSPCSQPTSRPSRARKSIEFSHLWSDSFASGLTIRLCSHQFVRT